MEPKGIGAILIAASFVLAGSLSAPGVKAQESSASSAGEKWYQVEVVVFERRGSSVLEQESWNPNPGHPPIEASIALIAPGESPLEGPGPHAFRILPEDALILNKVRGHLGNSSETSPILHVGWRQPGVPKDDAQWVNLYLPPRDGSAARETRNLLGQAKREGVEDSSAQGQPALIPLDLLQEPMVSPPLLDGTVRVHLSRYLHADVDLVYHRDDVEFPFRLATSRRMRSGELHYLDHPVFGVLIKVVPYEPEKIS